MTPHDLNDMDTEMTGRPLRDGPPPLPYCAEHTSYVEKMGEVHARVCSTDERAARMEDKIDRLVHENHEVKTELVSLRKDVEHYSKFWGAVSGLVAGIAAGFFGKRIDF